MQDPGCNGRHPCTFCGRAPDGTHDLSTIGTYPNGEPITRPVCSACTEQLRPERVTPLAVLERQETEKAIRLCNGSVGRAARLLGIGRATLYRRLDLWRVDDQANAAAAVERAAS